ncbi:hypothetical protein CONLIGDRAFT_440933 [Coniochaeta ligniaria NRRL 30616]|uniref:Uncharacterized protein n=1 Tax=Coniochaeta ligniaria NRRL 30616 TaxID=1408157 RepID=A0A1J7IJY9_9PEZI|nr:hypothetical protein CONLIGDRAFT_440933 [Coniochaeta ligniaria NRRL 30616]
MASRTDEELDRDWKPNGRRPQSTIARSFSQELMDIFRIENSVADLDEQVDRRKQQLNSQNSELEALEARIREMEQRLQQRSSPNSSLNQRLAQAHAQHQVQSAAINSQRGHDSRQQRRSPIAGVFPQQGDQQEDVPPPLPEKDNARAARSDKYGAGSRPGTARQSQQAVPGALPPTPTSSDGEDA